MRYGDDAPRIAREVKARERLRRLDWLRDAAQREERLRRANEPPEAPELERVEVLRRRPSIVITLTTKTAEDPAWSEDDLTQLLEALDQDPDAVRTLLRLLRRASRRKGA